MWSPGLEEQAGLADLLPQGGLTVKDLLLSGSGGDPVSSPHPTPHPTPEHRSWGAPPCSQAPTPLFPGWKNE